jgi:hypothetical protein
LTQLNTSKKCGLGNKRQPVPPRNLVRLMPRRLEQVQGDGEWIKKVLATSAGHVNLFNKV